MNLKHSQIVVIPIAETLSLTVPDLPQSISNYERIELTATKIPDNKVLLQDDERIFFKEPNSQIGFPEWLEINGQKFHFDDFGETSSRKEIGIYVKVESPVPQAGVLLS